MAPRPREVLFGAFAVKTGLLDAAALTSVGMSEGAPGRLVEAGLLTADARASIEQMVEFVVRLHGGEERAVEAMGAKEVLFRSFGGSDLRGGAAPNAEDASSRVPEAAEGRYRILEDQPELGRGAIGRVLAAMDEHLGREVAIKELLITPGVSAGRKQALEKRFLREARVTGRLEHPGIVPVHELARRADGTLFYVMKRVRGRTLRTAMTAARDASERLRLLPQLVAMANAIGYAHSRGVIHRDIKPENVMLGEFGEAVVLDWGLCKVRGADDPRGQELLAGMRMVKAGSSTIAGGGTIAGVPIGTPGYMSPEQAEGALEHIDERSDVWSLGVILFELLAGRPPFTGDSPLDVVGNILRGAPPNLAEVAAGTPPGLQALAMRALSREKKERFAHAGEFAAALEAELTRPSPPPEDKAGGGFWGKLRGKK